MRSHTRLPNVKLLVTAARPTCSCIILPVDKMPLYYSYYLVFFLFSYYNEPRLSLGMEICKWSGCSWWSNPSVCFHVGSRQLVRGRLSQFPSRAIWQRARWRLWHAGEVMCGKHRNNIQLTATPRPPLTSTRTRPFAFQQLKKSFGN